MSIILMPSQEEITFKLLKRDRYFRRNNSILLGKSQTGKTELVKHISNNCEDFIYINFVEDGLDEFISDNRLRSLSLNDFYNYLRDRFDGTKSKKIIVDELDSVVNIIVGNISDKITTFYTQLLEMDISTEFIFVSSIFDDEIELALKNKFKDKIFTLHFNNGDKEHIIRNHLNNNNLFDLSKISNLRQLLNP